MNTITLPDGTFYQFTYETTPGDTHSPHNVTGRVASITLPTGGTVSYNYTGTNNGIECADGSTSGLTRTTPDGTWTYTRTLGTGAASTTTVEDPKGNYTVIQFQGIYETQRQTYQGTIAAAHLLQTINTCYNGAAVPCTVTAITLPVLSRTVTTQLGTAASSVQSKKVYTYNIYGLTTEEDDYDWGPTTPGAVLKKTIITYNTSLGAIENLPASVTIENGSGAPVTSAALTYDVAALTATTGTPQQATLPAETPRGNLTTLAVTANASTTLYRQFTYYDTGNPNTSTAVSTSSTTPGATTTYNYAAGTASCGNSFATSVSEPLSLSHSMTWNCVGAVELTATEENGVVTGSTYTDQYFWRPSETTDALLNNTLLTYTGANIAESALNFNGTVSTVDLRITTDGLGRPELTQKKQSQTATNYDTTQSVYDLAGLLKHTTLPFSAAAGGTNPTAPGPTTTYDGLDRPLQVSDSGGGTVTYGYSKNDVLVTSGPAPSGENTKRRQMEYDGLGRLSSVCELTTATGSGTCGQNTTQTGYWTRYTYDANGNRTGVTQNAQAAAAGRQTRTYVYDKVSRMTSETNPESGTKTYTYDSDATCGSSTSQAGQLVKRVDALSNVTCYAYDALNRNTSITYPSGSYAANTPSKTFVYDATTFTCSNPSGAFVIGRLAEAFTGPSTAKVTDIAFCYSARGETTDVFESTPASGGYYHTTASYWANGATETLSGVPGLSSWAFAPDGEGRPYSATYGTSTWVSGATYYPSNSSNPPTNTVAFGNGDADVYSLDANTGRVNQFQFTAGATPQSLTGVPGWNANGALGTLGITDQFNTSNAQNCSYVHDDLARIQSVNCVNGSTGIWNQSFTPTDPFGNVSKSGSSSYVATYLLSNGSTNNQEQTVGSCVPSFDANGNLTKDCSNSNVYTWDADGNFIGINAQSRTAAWIGVTYDALDREVETTYVPAPLQPGVAGRGQESCPGSLTDTCTEFLYSPIGKLGRMNVQTPLTMRFPLPGGSTAELIGATGATENTLHADWLGSARLSTSYVNRTLTYDLAYAPFGEAYAASGTYTAGDLNFTGQSLRHNCR